MESESPLVINSPGEGLCFKTQAGACHFELRKAVAEPVAFKVLSKFPLIYRVHPNMGVIEGPVGRTKSISVNLANDRTYTAQEVAGITSDILLVDAVRVNDVVKESSNDAPAPPAKKANKSGQAFDWSKVVDRSKVVTLRLRSKLTPLLRVKLNENAGNEKQKTTSTTSTSTGSDELENGKEVEEQQKEEVPVAEQMSMECDDSNNNSQAVVVPANEPEHREQQQQQPQIDENVEPQYVEVIEMTLASEPGCDLPEIEPALDLVNLFDELRKIDLTAACANRLIRKLRTNGSEFGLTPLLGIADKVITAAAYRNAIRQNADFSMISESVNE